MFLEKNEKGHYAQGLEWAKIKSDWKNEVIIVRDEKEVSAKALDWLSFSDSVFYHIENYVIPQYGDKGEDQVSSLDASDCIKAIQKYYSFLIPSLATWVVEIQSSH